MFAVASPPAATPRSTRPTICERTFGLVVGRAISAVRAFGRSTPSSSMPTETITASACASNHGRSAASVSSLSECSALTLAPSRLSRSASSSAFSIVVVNSSVRPHCAARSK